MTAFPKSAFAAVAFITGASCAAADWTHVMGPQFNRKSPDSVSAFSSAKQPRKIWEIQTNGGFSSFVTGNGKAFTMHVVDGLETVIGLDRKTGRTLWQTSLGRAQYRNGGERNGGKDGPRSTPVFADNRLFVFGGNFDLHALDSATGAVIWKRDLLGEYGGQQIEWSNAASPLVLGDRVLVSGGGAGQSFLAFRTDNGAVIWKKGSDRPTHSTPVLATIHEQVQALFMVARGLVSIDPSDGRELWHYPFDHRTSTAASPVVWQDIVNCSAAYGVGGGAARITRNGDTWQVAELWRIRGDREVAAHWSTAVAHEGYLYGCYGRANDSFGTGPFKCVDIRTGEIKWTQPGFGPSQVIMAGNRLVATTDTGRLVLIEPTPATYREIAKFDAVEGKVWSSPAISDGQVFLRSTTQGVCLEL